MQIRLQGQQPRDGKILQAFRVNDTLIADLRFTTSRTFSVWLISKVLAASWGAQLLQMLSFNSQVPLSVLWAPETVLTVPDCADCTDVSWTTWVRLTHGAEKQKAKFLRMIKRRVHLPVTLAAALFTLGNDGFGIPELHLTAS